MRTLTYLFEISSREHEHRDDQQHGDVANRVADGHHHVTERYRLAVNDGRLDVELRQVRQDPVQTAGKARGCWRIENVEKNSAIAVTSISSTRMRLTALSRAGSSAGASHARMVVSDTPHVM